MAVKAGDGLCNFERRALFLVELGKCYASERYALFRHIELKGIPFIRSRGSEVAHDGILVCSVCSGAELEHWGLLQYFHSV